MKHFIYDEVDRIKLDGEDWIDVKRCMSYGDQQKLVASYMQLQTQLKTVTTEVAMDLETGNITLLLLNIKAWSLKGQDGKIAPINEVTIKQLKTITANKIISAINKRNPVPKV